MEREERRDMNDGEREGMVERKIGKGGERERERRGLKKIKIV